MNCFASRIITSGYSYLPQCQVELPEDIHKYLTKLISTMTSFMNSQIGFDLALFAELEQS